MGDFVRAATDVLTLSPGRTLTVKRRLNMGDVRILRDRYYERLADGTLVKSLREGDRAFVLVYLVDWTLTDDDGRRVPISPDKLDDMAAALDALDPLVYTEIREAIEAHDRAVSAAAEREKKTRNGESAS